MRINEYWIFGIGFCLVIKEEALKVIKKSKDTFEEFLSNPVELPEDRP